MAVPNSLQSLVEDGVIDSVESQLMSGKEASVYVVSYRGAFVAAKVYKAREQRTFKATSSYTEGRNQTRNTRDKRAMGKRTAYGRELLEESWRDMEYRALFDAMRAGVRVPKPIMLYDDVLLMELLVDEDGAPAPRLADFDVAPESAEALHHDLYRQVRLLLSTGRVHGDLSAFNVLMTHAGPTLIDLPQVVDASGNNQAREILRRDLQNVTEHLARFDARLLRFRHCGDGLWAHFQRGTLDQATHPQEGGVRDDRRGGGGRRAALAQSGRMGRGDGGRGEAPSSGQRQDRGRQGGPRPQEGRRDAPRQDGPPPVASHAQGGPRHDGARRDGPRAQSAPRHEGARRDGPRPDRPRQDGPAAQAGPRHRSDDGRAQAQPGRDPERRRDAPSGERRDDERGPRGERSQGRHDRAPVPVDYVRRSGGKPR